MNQVIKDFFAGRKLVDPCCPVYTIQNAMFLTFQYEGFITYSSGAPCKGYTVLEPGQGWMGRVRVGSSGKMMLQEVKNPVPFRSGLQIPGTGRNVYALINHNYEL